MEVEQKSPGFDEATVGIKQDGDLLAVPSASLVAGDSSATPRPE